MAAVQGRLLQGQTTLLAPQALRPYGWKRGLTRNRVISLDLHGTRPTATFSASKLGALQKNIVS